MIFTNNVFNAAGGEVLELPSLMEAPDNLQIGAALLLRRDDKLDLWIRVLAGANHCG